MSKANFVFLHRLVNCNPQPDLCPGQKLGSPSLLCFPHFTYLIVIKFLLHYFSPGLLHWLSNWPYLLSSAAEGTFKQVATYH